MDIERIRKISEAKINAGKQVSNVRNKLKEIKHGMQDVQEELSEVYKPIVTAQEDVKQKIDEKQDKMLEQLQKNQKALTSGLEDLIIIQQLPDAKPQEAYKLPLDYEPEMLKPEFKSDIDTGFDTDEIKKLMEYGLYAPSDVLKSSIDGTLDIDEYNKNLGKKIQKIGLKKAHLSTTKKNKKKMKTELMNYQKISVY